MAAMLPFFGGITAVVGTFGFIPLDFVLPMLLYNMTYKPTKRSFTHVLDKHDDYGCVHSGPARKFHCVLNMRTKSNNADGYQLCCKQLLQKNWPLKLLSDFWPQANDLPASVHARLFSKWEWGVADALPPPPTIIPPIVEPVRVKTEVVEKKNLRVPMARLGFGLKGQKIPLLTNHFKVNVANLHEYFHQYNWRSSIMMGILLNRKELEENSLTKFMRFTTPSLMQTWSDSLPLKRLRSRMTKCCKVEEEAIKKMLQAYRTIFQ
ncbi:hypothetical protein YC2023_031736 [Brassica napus]